jgi:adenylate cyclase
VVNYFNEGIAYYRKRNFKRSIKQFEAALQRNPRDKLSRTYIERCQLLIKDPPPEDWVGIWEMHEK